MSKHKGRAFANTLIRGVRVHHHEKTAGWVYRCAAKYLDVPSEWVPAATPAGWRAVKDAVKTIRYWEEQDRLRSLPQPKKFTRILSLKRCK